jgi:SAM-dependent methyltransferase
VLATGVGSAPMPTAHWRAESDNWARWARSGSDGYWQYHEAFFDHLVPTPRGSALDIGCGEGRTSRDLALRQHHPVGLDASPTLVAYARDVDPDGHYLVADAAALPFADATFDLAVAYNSLMDVDDMPGSVAEAARVLRPGGRLCVCIVHPIADAGAFTERKADAPFVITGSYLEDRLVDETFQRGDMAMRFQSRCYPMETYAGAFEAAGLLLETLREPPVPERAVRENEAERRWQRVPLFLFMRLVKPPSQRR